MTAIEPVQKPTIFYDTELKGFGLKVHPSGVLSWIIEYRPNWKETIVLGNAAIALLADLDRVGKYVKATTRSRFRLSWDTRGLQIRILLARN